MTTFLKLVADDLRQRFPDGMQNLTVVFPGKRARLFLNEHILNESDGPVWAPTSRTMQELFTTLSPYALIDPIEAICLLYKVYSRLLPEDSESLDMFYGWGEVLLSDFEDIDKHLVDARALFCNIEDLERLTSDRFLSEEQEKTLQRFFSTFSVENNSLLRERFRRMWHAMPNIYTDFRQEIMALGRVTEGVMYRDVIERLRRGEIEIPSQNTYAFVGLNALNDVEKALMHHLKASNQALFYWDYDQWFLKDSHEAGIFMTENIGKDEFKNALDGKFFNNLCSKKKFTYVATAGKNIQSRYIPQWLKDINYNSQSQRVDTAIVLCDETLLEPVLHALPNEENGGPRTANITMGYPMTSTPIYSLLRAIMNLHTNGWDNKTKRFRAYERRLVERNPLIMQDVKDNVITINKHEDSIAWLAKYMRGITEFVAGRQTEKPPKNSSTETAGDALASESIFRAYTALQHIEELIDSGILDVSMTSLCSIIDQALTRITIPFHGEPAEGLQIMGVLETRCLDFDNILLLSVGEGKMPQSSHTPSFIPYSLRRPFGLTTIEHKVGIQAYYFYRLLERAKDITFVYDTANADGVKNEMSRFLRQLLVEMRLGEKFPDAAISIKPDVTLPHSAILKARKTPEAMDKIRSLDKMSPTALEQYIQCPLKYYLHYVGGIDEFHEQEDEMDAATFGNIFHSSAEHIYKQFIGHTLTAEDLKKYTADTPQARRELQYIIDKNFDKLYFQPRGMTHENMDGALAIRRDVITRYIANLLNRDLATLETQKREIIGCELKCQTNITLSDGKTVVVGGIIDRLDKVTESDGTVRLQIIDYKTMSRRETSDAPKADMDLIFTQDKKYLAHIFQTFIYSLTLLDQNLPIQPTVFYTQDSSAANYTALITFNGQTLTDFRPLATEFRERLTDLLEEIFAGEQFVQTENKQHCQYCPFTDICRI